MVEFNGGISEGMEILEAVSKQYNTAYYINLEDGSYNCLKASETYKDIIPDTGNAQEAIALFCKSVPEDYFGKIKEFTNLDTLNERLSSSDSMVFEHKNMLGQWARTGLIVVRRGNDRKITRILLTSEDIDDERKIVTESEKTAKSNKEMLTALKDVYVGIHSIDLSSMTFETIICPDYLAQVMPKMGDVNTAILSWVNSCIDDTSKAEALSFCNIATIQDRLKETNVITCDLLTTGNGWCKQILCVTKRDFNNKATRLLWLSREIKEEKDKEKDLLDRIDEATKAVEDANTLKASIISKMSYDIRTPLNGIAGMIRIAKENMHNPAKIEDCLDKIDESSKYLLVLINEVLDISKGDKEKAEEQQEDNAIPVINASDVKPTDVPVEVTSNEETPAATEAQADNLDGMRVLLVEDNELNIEVAEYLLEEMGCVVEKAVNGKIAVDMFTESEEFHYDAVLMDIMMPVMNGHDATKAIRALDRKDAGNIPIIAMTANAFARDAEAAFACGMNEHIPKPIDHDVLESTLLKYYHKK